MANLFDNSLAGNWLRLQPTIDAMERGDDLSTEECRRICGKPLLNMLGRIKRHVLKTRGIHACMRDGKLYLLTDQEQAAVLPKAVDATRRKIKRSIRAHAGVDVAKLSQTEQRRHEYNAARAAFLLGAHKEIGRPELEPPKEKK